MTSGDGTAAASRAAVTVEPAFVAALGDPSTPPPRTLTDPDGRPAGRRFDVYRNNVVAGRVETLAAAFPATVRLVGEDFFKVAAKAFADEHPPTSPLLFRYGAGLPDFLARLPGLQPYPYVPDVARIEWARLQALHAADAAPLEPAALGAIPPDRLARARLAPHPALAIVLSEWPSATICLRNLSGGADAEPLAGAAEAAIITRPQDEVLTAPATLGTGLCFSALVDGHTLSEAAGRAAAADPAFDFAAALTLGLAAGAFTGVPTAD